MRTRMLVLLAIVVVLTIGWSGQGRAETAAEFYKKNVVTIYATSKPGGGTDLAARLFVTYWQQYTGGFMKLVNEPGGGGLVGGNLVYASNPDGLTLGTGEIGGDIIGPFVAKVKGLQYNAGKLGWIGMFGGEAYAFALSVKLPYNSMAELKQAKQVILAGMTPGGTSNVGACLVCDVFGLPGLTLYGHEGSAESGMAMARGELDAYAMNSSTVKDNLDKGWVKKPLVIVDYRPSSLFPGVPAISDAAKLTPDQLKILNYYTTALKAGKGFYTSPGVPADRIEYLRSTFDKIMADKAFLSQAKLRWPSWEAPIGGKDLDAIVDKAVLLSPADLKLVENLIAKYNKKK